MGVISFQIRFVQGFSVGSFSTEERRRFFENNFRHQLLPRKKEIYNYMKTFSIFLRFCRTFPKLYFLKILLLYQGNCSSAKLYLVLFW